MRPSRPVIASVVTVGALALVAAGCGAGSAAPQVASVASATTGAPPTTQSSGGSAGGAPGGSNSGQGQFTMGLRVGAADGMKFSACMRKQGIINFPDPNSQGLVSIHSGMGIDPSSPAFGSARKVCDKLLPNGGQPSPAQLAKRQQRLLAFSVCMRAHGIKDFPDPTNGGINIQSGPGSDLNPNNPTFQNAQHACQGNLEPTAAPAPGG